MNIIVQKYGGSSVGTIEKINKVADKIIKAYEAGNKMVVIVSAMANTTNDLIAMAKGISKNPSQREMDMLLTTGEQISISLLAMALIEKGYEALSFTGFQLNIKTTDIHQKARIKDIDTSKILEALNDGKIVVVAGFQGINEKADYTTLGRGGSDTSAVALAAKLNARCEIYTDVEGIYTMDPRKLKNAKKLDYISYEEMMEMASLGAGVIHYRAVELAYKYNLDLYLGSSFSLNKGTNILDRSMIKMEDTIITGMASCLDDVQITVLNLPACSESLFKLFGNLAENEVNVDMISQMLTDENRMNISFTIPEDDFIAGERILNQWQEEDPMISWQYKKDIAKISVVGSGMRSNPGVAGKVFEIMAKNNIEIKMVTTSEIKITWIVDAKDEQNTIDLIGDHFNLTQ